jgi:hypothetical protein
MRKLVLWGHHAAEYTAMFDVSEAGLHSRVLEYGCGPSAVNAELHHDSRLTVSCDPLFSLTKPELIKKVTVLMERRVQQVLAFKGQFNVDPYGGMDAFIASRRAGVNAFFSDYDAGRVQKRYVSPEKDATPFKDSAFDYALSSHYFFSDPKTQSVDFHVQVLGELARVANDVRIFPLIDRLGQPSPLLGPVLLGLQQANFGVEVREVACPLYPAGNAMLRVWAQQCSV